MSPMLTPINDHPGISGDTGYDDEMQRLRRVIREGYAACVRRPFLLSMPNSDLLADIGDNRIQYDLAADIRAILALREEAEKPE